VSVRRYLVELQAFAPRPLGRNSGQQALLEDLRRPLLPARLDELGTSGLEITLEPALSLLIPRDGGAQAAAAERGDLA